MLFLIVFFMYKFLLFWEVKLFNDNVIFKLDIVFVMLFFVCVLFDLCENFYLCLIWNKGFIVFFVAVLFKWWINKIWFFFCIIFFIDNFF